jgi:hypothetical protein
MRAVGCAERVGEAVTMAVIVEAPRVAGVTMRRLSDE